MLIAVVAIGAYAAFAGVPLRLPARGVVYAGLTGVIVALHWLFFFESIKRSTVSVGLVCLSTGSLFTSLFEPIFYRRPARTYEVMLGLTTVAGVLVVFRFETQYIAGIVIGLASAATGALFTVANGRLVALHDSRAIGMYELGAGAGLLTAYVFLMQQTPLIDMRLVPADLAYLLILGIVCTAFAFVASIHVMRAVSPFSFILALNLEPVYGILLALLIFGESEYMSTGFYLGAVVILFTLWVDAIIKRRARSALLLNPKGDYGTRNPR